MTSDFDIGPYRALREELLLDGIKFGLNSRHQITVSSQSGPIWPKRGNSFWITCAPGCWFIFPWYSLGYAVPDESRLAELCRRCMSVGESAMYDIPEEIKVEFQLRELTESESEAVWAAMKAAP